MSTQPDTMRETFESWRSKQPWFVVCEGQEPYALMNHAAESSWQAATALATAAERERCAKACEAEHVGKAIGEEHIHPEDMAYNRALQHAADAIRKGEALESEQ